jgi:hypothetical protein
MARTMRTMSVLVAALAISMTACSGPTSAGPSSGAATVATGSSPGPSAGTPGSPTSSVTPGGAVPFPASTSPTTGTASADARLTVSEVTVGAHDGYDRVVLTLGGAGSPGWRAEYVDTPVDDPSDQVLQIDGSAYLRLVIDGTGYPQDTGVAQWAGSPLRPGGSNQVQEVALRGVFEGQTLAFVGLDHAAPFRVFTLTDPTRLVVDVWH